MNVFQYAEKMEQDGEAYYRELLAQASNPGIKTIFSELANTEQKHYQTFKQMEDNQEPDMKRSLDITTSKNIFSQMIGKGEVPDPLSETDAYAKALEMEKRSREFYEKMAAEIKNAKQKTVLLAIAEEEKQHYILIENMIEFLQKPKTWLENAEWNHLDEY